MKNKMTYLYIGLAALLVATGVIVYQAVFSSPQGPTTPANAYPTPVPLPTVDSSVSVSLTAAAKPNTVSLTAKGLAGKYTSIGYEFTYESQGLIKGVNSGSTPIDVSGKDDFTREVYMGTCSRNVCTPDVGVKSISVVMEFTDTSGARSQFTKDFDL